MSVDKFIKQLKEVPSEITFSNTMAILDENYDFSPVAFYNGELFNKAGENNGSCKIFSFGKLHNLSKEFTLNCFGEYYTEVLQDPAGEGHWNIRNFLKTGWDGVKFNDTALKPK